MDAPVADWIRASYNFKPKADPDNLDSLKASVDFQSKYDDIATIIRDAQDKFLAVYDK